MSAKLFQNKFPSLTHLKSISRIQLFSLSTTGEGLRRRLAFDLKDEPQSPASAMHDIDADAVARAFMGDLVVFAQH